MRNRDLLEVDSVIVVIIVGVVAAVSPLSKYKQMVVDKL